MRDNLKKLNLYIHIPFCAHKCTYCAFYTLIGREEYIPRYVSMLINELRSSDLTNYDLTTIYFGGGTPSLLTTTQLEAILNTIPRSIDCEVTLEANPESLTLEKLKGYKAAGINRLSIGLEAWQNHILTELGRHHTHEQFSKVFREARETGFTNISVDAIFGLPNQTLVDWQETVSEIIALSPEHISCYSLELDHQSLLGAKVRLGHIPAPNEELDRRMADHTAVALKAAGYLHYEVSNFAKEGFQCHHNTNFWHGEDYRGFGVGAHSCLGGNHFHNKEAFFEYLENPCGVSVTDPSGDKRIEWLTLRLRLIEGFTSKEYLDTFSSSFSTDFDTQIATLKQYELISTNERIKLTSKGQNLINKVMEILNNHQTTRNEVLSQ